MSASRWRSPMVLLAIALLFHAAKFLILFRDVRLAAPYPLVNVDYVYYYSGILRLSRLLSHSGRFWGYDPFEMAGTLTGPVNSADYHLFALICWMMSRVVPIARSLLALELLSFAVAPLLFAAAVAMYAGTASGAAALLLATLMYGTFEPISNGSLRHGLWAFQVLAWLTPLTVALLDRWLRSRRAWAWAAATAMTAGLALLTPLSPTVIGLPMAILLVYRARTLDKRQGWLVGLSAAIVLAACWPWARPLFAFPGWRGAVGASLRSMGWAGILDLFSPFGGWSRPMAVCLRLLILGLAFDWFRRQPKETRLFFGAWLALLGSMAVFGSSLPGVSTLQPARFAIPFWLLVYAGAGMRLCEKGFMKTAPGKISVGLLATGLACEALTIVIPGAGFLWPRLTNQLPREQQAILDILSSHRPLPGRILIECIDDGRPQFTELISAQQGQADIGGPMSGDLRPTRFTLFATSAEYDNHPMFAQKPLEALTEADFGAYLKLYDVSTVVARSPVAQRALSRYNKLLEPLARAGDALIYDVRQPPSWLLTGTAREVSFDYDRLTLDGASRGLLVLKFHWLKTLRADPPMVLAPVYVMDDPVPFIALRNDAGAPRITISD